MVLKPQNLKRVTAHIQAATENDLFIKYVFSRRFTVQFRYTVSQCCWHTIPHCRPIVCKTNDSAYFSFCFCLYLCFVFNCFWRYRYRLWIKNYINFSDGMKVSFCCVQANSVRLVVGEVRPSLSFIVQSVTVLYFGNVTKGRLRGGGGGGWRRRRRCGGGAKSQLTVAAVVSFDSTELTSTRTDSLSRIFFASAP